MQLKKLLFQNKVSGLSLTPTYVFILLCSLSSCSEQASQSEQVTLQGQTMGTFYSIKLISEDKHLHSTQLKHKIDARLKAINASMSTYISDSELSLFNQSTSTDWFAVSEELFSVIQFAQEISKVSNGGFDITVGPLVNLWGFGPDKKTLTKPDSTTITETLNNIGYKNILLNPDTNAIKKNIPSLYIDLSAIAKGYGVDSIAALLEANNIYRYMIEIGGEVRAAGKNTQEKPWQIGIEKPVVGERSLQRVIALNNEALASSGNYRNFFEIDGVRYSHTINPSTGNPVQHSLASVTVLAETAMQADAWATTLMVLGLEPGLELAKTHGIAALFTLHSNESSTGFIEHFSRLFPK